MNILSFDCANRSLAVCFMTINMNILADLTAACKDRDANKCIELINGYAVIHLLKVFDLTKGQKTDTVNRTRLLKECLNNIDGLIKDTGVIPNQVLIEYQMSANDKSRCVSTGILYHYSCTPVNIHIMGPSLKNKVCFSRDNTLAHSTFIAKYASKYTANKNHAKENLLYWLKMNGVENIIADNKIAKKNIDDAADAFMQIWGWVDYVY